MKYYKPKIIVVPHNVGSKNKAEIFRKIFTEQVEKRLKEKQLNENENSREVSEPEEK